MYSISVIIPCYNSEATIVEALDSIFIQKKIVNEIIIIDDGSTDNTVSIIKQYIQNSAYKNFILIEQVNSGPSIARNKGIKISNYEWIAFLDSDDKWTPDKLDIQLSILKSNPDISIISGGHNKSFFNRNIFYKKITIRKLCFKNFFETPTVLVKKNVCAEYYFDEKMKYAEDYNLWLNILSKYKGIYINKILSESIIKKHAYGDSGLSKNIFLMEKGELKSIKNQKKLNNISLLLFVFSYLFSIIKFSRRLIITTIRN